jgi:hypothetical protein
MKKSRSLKLNPNLLKRRKIQLKTPLGQTIKQRRESKLLTAIQSMTLPESSEIKRFQRKKSLQAKKSLKHRKKPSEIL